MSLDLDFRRDLTEAVTSDLPLLAIVERLREYRKNGVTRDEVRSFLESLREGTDDEAAEDRILDVLDFVEGFCNVEHVVWDD